VHSQEYIRHLVFDVLCDGDIVVVLRKLLKLPWQECERYVLKCLLKVGGLTGRLGTRGGRRWVCRQARTGLRRLQQPLVPWAAARQPSCWLAGSCLPGRLPPARQSWQ
jgi:hypothetical protein